MVEVEKELRAGGYSHEDAHIALNMHDEMILEAKDSIVGEVAALVYEVMCKKVEGFLPFSVDLRTGKNWLDISK